MGYATSCSGAMELSVVGMIGLIVLAILARKTLPALWAMRVQGMVGILGVMLFVTIGQIPIRYAATGQYGACSFNFWGLFS